MGRESHHAIVPLRGNERSVLDRTETYGQILPMPSDETCVWLRALHRAFCERDIRGLPWEERGAVLDAHKEAEQFLLGIFRKICVEDHPLRQNPEIIQSLSENCFVAGGTFHRPADNPSWNEPPPKKRKKRS